MPQSDAPAASSSKAEEAARLKAAKAAKAEAQRQAGINAKRKREAAALKKRFDGLGKRAEVLEGAMRSLRTKWATLRNSTRSVTSQQDGIGTFSDV